MKRLRTRGFTILEVLIVLAIAALILLVIFIAVPSLNRNQRNTDRKQFVAFVAGALDEYRATTNASGYPDTPTAMCQFMNNYLKERAGDGGTCTGSYVNPGLCVRLNAQKYTICYHDRDSSSHSYIGPTDEISIQLAHWCTPTPNPYPADEGNPITSGNNPTDEATYYYVIWTQLEPSGMICRDNFSK